MVRWFSLVVLCGCLYWMGCLPKSEAVGSNHEVVVIVSAPTWEKAEGVVRAIFERKLYTPQEEIVFTLRVVEPEDFDFYKNFRNVLILAPLDVQDTGGELVETLISGQAKAQILSGQAYMFLKEDVWRRGQTIMVLSGPDEESLMDHLLQNAEEIYQVQESALNEKVKAWLYEKAEQKKLGEKLYRTYGWSIRVPQEYDLDQERPAERFLFLRRTVPDRWLFVYWEDAEGPQTLTEEWCLTTRAHIGTTFYSGDSVVEEFTQIERVMFLDREALCMKGLWQNRTAEAGYAAGGPFRSYCFYDAKTKRLYMVDIAVFAPGMNKEPYLRQLDIIAHTFRT
jgi:hypothetical protein